MKLSVKNFVFLDRHFVISFLFLHFVSSLLGQIYCLGIIHQGRPHKSRFFGPPPPCPHMSALARPPPPKDVRVNDPPPLRRPAGGVFF